MTNLEVIGTVILGALWIVGLVTLIIAVSIYDCRMEISGGFDSAYARFQYKRYLRFKRKQLGIVGYYEWLEKSSES